MNDTELDRLLDMWEAPAPPPSLRAGMRARFPRVERRRFRRPFQWALAIGVALAVLAIGAAQSGGNPADFWPVRVFNQVYESIVLAIELRQGSAVMVRLRHSEYKVYVDGQLVAAPPQDGSAFKFEVNVPGEGVYWIIPVKVNGWLGGWVEAGRFHGNVIEFQAGGKQVRIECSQPLVDYDRPVFVRRRP